MVDDGVIKFSISDFQKTAPIKSPEYEDLEKVREQLFLLNLIGEYLPEKIGFGNLSLRKDYSNLVKADFPQFLITGTQTGSLKKLNGSHYTRVVDGSLDKKSIACRGPIMASSESLTHGSLYQARCEINVILHVHHRKLWSALLKGGYPKTNKDTPYGTKEMAEEVAEVIKKEPSGILVMEGHQDGVVFYGQNLEETAKLALDTYHELVT